MEIDRAFIRIAEGQVHYRTGGVAVAGKLPLYMIHASPTSSLRFLPMMQILAEQRLVIAPDTLGNGDSAPPALDVPEMDYYADSVARVLDALKLDRVDLYGSHTGAHIGCEVAIRHPDRVRKLVLDGIGMFSDADRADFLAHYALEMTPDDYGRQFIWAWHFLRDQVLYFPYFKRTPEYARFSPMPAAAQLHGAVVEVLKSLTTYHKGYRAAFRHPDRLRLPLVTQPTFCMASEDDPLKEGVTEASVLVRNSHHAILPPERTAAGLKAKVDAVAAFLDG